MPLRWPTVSPFGWVTTRSEDHTSELQSRPHLVCRLLLEKKQSASRPFEKGLQIEQRKPALLVLSEAPHERELDLAPMPLTTRHLLVCKLRLHCPPAALLP